MCAEHIICQHMPGIKHICSDLPYPILTLLNCVREKGDLASALDRCGELALVNGTCTCHSLGKDLSVLGNKLLQKRIIHKINALYLVSAEIAYLPAAVSLSHVTGKFPFTGLGGSILSHFFVLLNN